jgi:hypothetical protein
MAIDPKMMANGPRMRPANTIETIPQTIDAIAKLLVFGATGTGDVGEPMGTESVGFDMMTELRLNVFRNKIKFEPSTRTKVNGKRVRNKINGKRVPIPEQSQNRTGRLWRYRFYVFFSREYKYCSAHARFRDGTGAKCKSLCVHIK